MSREEFLSASPRELDALLRHKYKSTATQLACLRSDIWNTALLQAGSDKRIEPEEFLGSGEAANSNDDMRSFVEEWERGQIAKPRAETLSAFKAQVSSRFKIQPGEVTQVRK